MTLGTRIVVMKDGVVQQVDTPQTLYNAPTNLFVAGFIGSPQMNFLDATVKVKGDEVYLHFDTEGFPMTARVNPRTTARTGDTVKFALDMEKVHVFDKETEQVITN